MFFDIGDIPYKMNPSRWVFSLDSIIPYSILGNFLNSLSISDRSSSSDFLNALVFLARFIYSFILKLVGVSIFYNMLIAR